MQAVIMAAGKSTRTYPLTLTRPKALLPLLNRPILAWQLEALSGIVEEVIVVVGYRADQIMAAFGDAWGGLRLRYVRQEQALGTGHAALQCADLITGPCLVLNGDDLYDGADLKRVASRPNQALARTVDDPRRFGIYEVDSDFCVKRLVEKPREVFSHLANIGAYSFAPSAFEVLRTLEPSERGEIEITSAVQALAEAGEFRVVVSEGLWHSIGHAWDLVTANEQLIQTHLEEAILGEVSPAAHLSGRVYVGPGAKIRPGVVIDGPVYVGAGAEVGPNCWLRPGATLGEGCKVGQASEIKNSILMRGAKAPHHNYVGDSVVGEEANLGCGTVTANLRHDGANVYSMMNGALVDSGRRKLGTIIGDGVHTGIHTSILPGRKLWPHACTAPGEVVRNDIVNASESG